MARADACSTFVNKSILSRREVLRLGGACGLGLSLPSLFQAREQTQRSPVNGTFGRAKSIIVLYLHGGHAQQETWDPKPDGPTPARGEFGAIATSVPGTLFGELLPRAARIAHKLAIIRSLSHGNANHVQASLPAMTGHAHPASVRTRGDFPPSPNDFPPFGAVLNSMRQNEGAGHRDARHRGSRQGRSLPTWVRVGPLMRRSNGTVLHGQLPGFLGIRNTPLAVDQDLLADDVRIEAVAPDPAVPVMRLTDRGRLLEQVERQRRELDQAAELQTFNAYHQRAFNLLSSPETAQAFDLAAEARPVRERYGSTQFGQRCLLARRLAEAGVPIINVHFCHTPRGSWDTHGGHFNKMKQDLCPTFDQAFTALVEDLDQRGLLDETLVLATAEFGRTPTVNRNAGRDHWPFVYSVAMAGAGTAAGCIYGSSDNIAGHPTSNPHDPRDLAATIYHLLGVPADTIIYDQVHRPHNLIIGQKIDGLLV